MSDKGYLLSAKYELCQIRGTVVKTSLESRIDWFYGMCVCMKLLLLLSHRSTYASSACVSCSIPGFMYTHYGANRNETHAYILAQCTPDWNLPPPHPWTVVRAWPVLLLLLWSQQCPPQYTDLSGASGVYMQCVNVSAMYCVGSENFEVFVDRINKILKLFLRRGSLLLASALTQVRRFMMGRSIRIISVCNTRTRSVTVRGL